jgi:Formyl transferase
VEEGRAARLRTMFVGSRNAFDELLVDWLAARTDLRGVIWTTSTKWRHSWRGRLDFVRTRLRRRGPLRTLDEMAFSAVYRRWQRERDVDRLERDVIAPHWAEHGRPEWGGDAIAAGDVNDRRVLDFVRDRVPDVVFAMCTNDWFGRELRAIPPLGILLWHDGITPEYRGLYAPFWAVTRLDFDRIGYTVLRVDDDYDAGEILAQGTVRDVDPFTQGHLYLGHRVVYESLPAVERLLHDLEAGRARALQRPGAESRLYTYPGLTDLVRQRRALRQARQGSTAPR